MSEQKRLSDLVEEEHAEEIARQHMPIKFKWEVNEKNSMTTVPDWIIKAMIEFRRVE